MLNVDDIQLDPTAISLFLFAHREDPDVLAFINGHRPAPARCELIDFLRVQLMVWKGDLTSAEHTLRTLFHFDPELGLEKVEDSIREHIKDPSVHFTTTYSGFPNSAMQSLGFFRHESSSGANRKVFITKVSSRAAMGREPLFYFTILPNSPGLHQISPTPVRYYSSSKVDVCLLTMELSLGTVPNIASMEAMELIKLVTDYQVVAEIDHAPWADQFNDLPYGPDFNHGYLAQAMHRIHEEGPFLDLMHWMVVVVTTRGYRKEVTDSVLALVTTLRRCRFHALVDPVKHYSFLHGDLHRHNVLSSEQGHVFIDWARCTIGPKQIDLATLLRRHGYRKSVEILEKAGAWNDLSDVNKMLFALAMVVVSLMIDIPQIKEEAPDLVFRPAEDHIAGCLRTSSK